MSSRTVRKPAKTDAEIGERDLKLVEELALEQASMLHNNAKLSKNKFAATWVAKGDHLALLIVDATNLMKPAQKMYVCRILDIKEHSSTVH